METNSESWPRFIVKSATSFCPKAGVVKLVSTWIVDIPDIATEAELAGTNPRAVITSLEDRAASSPPAFKKLVSVAPLLVKRVAVIGASVESPTVIVLMPAPVEIPEIVMLGVPLKLI
jgi:hypothetical protein